ncbi:MAG: hypothetical protein MR817_12500 [Lachnospiraceae bacterium]|nr:hypothetical protein [Lachnospiraceae bacterium]
MDIYEYEMIIQAIDQIYSCDDIPQLIQLVAITKSRIEKIGNTRVYELLKKEEANK